MRVQSLHLANFRNYSALSVTFSARKNIFLGNNGQGKTNLLEAIYFLSHARSHRTSSDRELIQTGQRFATISAQLTNHHYEGRVQLESQVKVEDERLKTVFKVNGSPLRSRSEMLGHLPTVSFFLPDLLLLRGTPEDRRRWLDAAIVQYDKRHLLYLNEFHKVRQQKNKLLKSPMEQISRDHLSAWNVQFAAMGAKVIASRQTYLSMIEDLAALAYLELSDNREQLTFKYQSTVLDMLAPQNLADHSAGLPHGAPLPDVIELEAALMRLLDEKMNDELRRGTCLVGPHRDDIHFYLDGLPADAYGSQGQQRSVVLALKLTELKCLSAKLQEPPVLLLDDVMAELDPDRQRLLVTHIHPESQVFMTTTHPTSSWQTLLERESGQTDQNTDSYLAAFTVDHGHLFDRLAHPQPELNS
ncbi:DNA replication/repair protein RecF [Vampirovibrio sp.]|uniref:DNA replication/repair protein RecF n=1 Tax=Vampirovibrio sp. TaxID=2717857 RepID=UPI003593C5ED